MATSTENLSSQIVGLSTGAPVLTVGAARVTADGGSECSIDGQTLRPRATITVLETKMSLASDDSYLVLGSSREKLQPVTRTTGILGAISNSTSALVASTANSTMTTSKPSLSLGSLTGTLTDTPTLTSLVETGEPTSHIKNSGAELVRREVWVRLMSIVAPGILMM